MGGRFCVWSQSAIEELEKIYGESGKRIPEACMDNADLARIINSDEIQSVLNPAKRRPYQYARKKNALRNIHALQRINPYAAEKKRKARAEIESMAERKDEIAAAKKKARLAKKQWKEQGKKFYEEASKQGDVCSNGFT